MDVRFRRTVCICAIVLGVCLLGCAGIRLWIGTGLITSNELVAKSTQQDSRSFKYVGSVPTLPPSDAASPNFGSLDSAQIELPSGSQTHRTTLPRSLRIVNDSAGLLDTSWRLKNEIERGEIIDALQMKDRLFRKEDTFPSRQLLKAF